MLPSKYLMVFHKEVRGTGAHHFRVPEKRGRRRARPFVVWMAVFRKTGKQRRHWKFETTHEVAAKERHRKKPSKKDGEKRREEKLRGRKRVVSENKAATAQKGKALRHGKGFRGR